MRTPLRSSLQALVISLLCFLAIACQSSATKSAAPGWIENPKDGAVGSCPTHVMGRHEQEELAIARARARLAARYGVTVDQVKQIHEKVTNDSSYITADTISQLVVKNKEVKAHVRATWYDKKNDTVWAWVYPIK